MSINIDMGGILIFQDNIYFLLIEPKQIYPFPEVVTNRSSETFEISAISLLASGITG